MNKNAHKYQRLNC